MTVLVFGRTGQVARELGKFSNVICVDRFEANLENPESCAAKIRSVAPRAVINAAAYTSVDLAEKQERLANIVNGNAPGAMARECAVQGIPFVSMSTDYVFDGSGEVPWKPTDLPVPIGAYGRSKLRGEHEIVGAGGSYAILRTSWVVSAHGTNFVKNMLRLSERQNQLSVVNDQIGGPTPARDLAATCVMIAEQLAEDESKAGIYHFAGTPNTSWADFARKIFFEANTNCEVFDILSTEFPTLARRPLNSRLDCSSLEKVFGIKRPDWRVELKNILTDLNARS